MNETVRNNSTDWLCRTTSAVCLRHPVLPETSTVKTATTTKKKNLVEILNTSLDEKHMNLANTVPYWRQSKNKSVQKFRTTSADCFRYQPSPRSSRRACLDWERRRRKSCQHGVHPLLPHPDCHPLHQRHRSAARGEVSQQEWVQQHAITQTQQQTNSRKQQKAASC